MNPLLSVICITFNQEQYIRKTLDSFLMQKTSFPIEVLVHDDFSNDRTTEIVKEYSLKYPNIIKPIFATSNQYSKGGWGFLNDMYYSASGKYIAMCEGDDYWSDVSKLEKQVQFLEEHPDYSICFHPVRITYEDGALPDTISPVVKGKKIFTLEALLKNNYINTCSVVYRRLEYENLPEKIMPHDLYMHLYHARHGKIGFINDVMATYRKQSGGVWWESGAHMERIYMRHRYSITNLFALLYTMFQDNKKHTSIINKHLDYLFHSFLDIDKKNKTPFFADTARDFPYHVARFTADQESFIEELRTENQRLSKDVSELLPAAQELAEIKGSRWHKLKLALPVKRTK